MTLDGGKTWLNDDPQHKWSIAWVTNDGSYVEQVAFHTVYIAGDYYAPEKGDPMHLTLDCIVADPIPAEVPPPATMPATRPNSPATFVAEIAAAEMAANRDQRVAHLRNALALRPDDPENLKIEFDLAVELGQRSPPRERESLEVFEDIIKRYDHQKYYRIDAEGTSESTELMVPRAGILCSSILNAVHDHKSARAYDEVAMNDLRWTFEKRKSDLLNAPKPRRPSNPIAEDMMRPGALEDQVAYWQKQRAMASAGGVDLLGPYGKPLVEAAVNQYRRSFEPLGANDLPKIMGRIIHDLPNTPLATEARRVIDAAHAGRN
ncbi:MAG: hypothetical protein ABSB74_09280 [Tepidisphaeraceae bacterium]